MKCDLPAGPGLAKKERGERSKRIKRELDIHKTSQSKSHELATKQGERKKRGRDRTGCVARRTAGRVPTKRLKRRR